MLLVLLLVATEQSTMLVGLAKTGTSKATVIGYDDAPSRRTSMNPEVAHR